MRPPLTAMLIGMVPQWPRVVTAVMLQLPSYLEALAGAAAQTIAEVAEARTMHRRLSIMGDLICELVAPTVETNRVCPAYREDERQPAVNALTEQSTVKRKME